LIDDQGNNEPVDLPIDGVLDLHTFHPRDVKELLPDYLAACRDKGIYEIRIIHGKGKGFLRETVHAQLKKLSSVESYRLAGGDAGGWGATLVKLKRAATTRSEIDGKKES
jgi:DNA-nicking Smr family endonuclease